MISVIINNNTISETIRAGGTDSSTILRDLMDEINNNQSDVNAVFSANPTPTISLTASIPGIAFTASGTTISSTTTGTTLITNQIINQPLNYSYVWRQDGNIIQ